ncbi:MAG: MMPL family transporter [Actinobacteria bacterium]|nr:MMPL family transporter [Actinomycetota bacterium]
MLERIARFSFRRRRIVLLCWVVVLVGLGVLQGVTGSAFRTDFTLPDSESNDGFSLLRAASGGDGGGFDGTIVFRADAGVTDPTVVATMTEVFDRTRGVEGVTSLVSPYDGEVGASQIAPAGPLAGKVAFARVGFAPTLGQSDFLHITEEVKELLPEQEGLQVELGGQVFAEFEPPESELLGLAFAVVILLVSFGSVLAMGLPIGVALFGVGTGVTLLTLASHLINMPDFTNILAAMIGLGVGIDYALFIVTRYREAVHRGLSFEDATAESITTAGRAVLFAGCTVVISLLGMLLMGLDFVRGLGIGASIAVAMTMVASITLLPALLGFAQARVEVTRYRGLVAALAVAVALFLVGLKLVSAAGVVLLGGLAVVLASFVVAPLRREVPRREPKPMRETMWFRWSRTLQRHPWVGAIGGLFILVVLALPVFSLRLGFADEGNFPETSSVRRAYDILGEAFGPGFNGPLTLVAQVAPSDSAAATGAVLTAVTATPGVQAALPVTPPDSPLLVVQVIPATSPQDEATEELVATLRDDVLPAVEASIGTPVFVTGTVPANIDFASFIAGRLPIFFGAVLGLSFLLLMAVFRSLLVPLKAVVMNLLSIGSAFGVVVAIFQWGWFGELVGIGKGAPIEAWGPMMMFAIVFGLSMDYEVFLLSRMKEEYDRTGDNATAVADGVATTARVITAAAAIMVFLFGSFLLESNRAIKVFGVGLATAVFLDATVVRMILVPATMELLGARNWWLPRWLDRILPRIDVEGGGHAVERTPEPVG